MPIELGCGASKTLMERTTALEWWPAGGKEKAPIQQGQGQVEPIQACPQSLGQRSVLARTTL